MKRIIFGISLIVFTMGFTGGASASALEAKVSVSKQMMTVLQGGQVLYRWPVSTARKGYVTPRGMWKPTRLHRMWHSRKYDNAPMPYSIFYHGGYAIHGTDAVRSLGRPASHGCVRLSPVNAKRLYSLVQEVGSANTRIVVTD